MCDERVGLSFARIRDDSGAHDPVRVPPMYFYVDVLDVMRSDKHICTHMHVYIYIYT